MNKSDKQIKYFVRGKDFEGATWESGITHDTRELAKKELLLWQTTDPTNQSIKIMRKIEPKNNAI